MDNLTRLDSIVLGHPETTPEGFLKVPCSVTRPGIFEYKNADGSTRRELRRPEQVYRADSMASLHQKPFTEGHPYHLDGEVNANNIRRARMRGMSGAPAYKLDGHLCVDLIITDADAIKDARAGKVAVSAGYKCDTLETPGVHPEYGPYDAEQVNITYNHIAQVKKARAGAGAKLRLDEAFNELNPEEPDMVKIKLDDGREIEVSEDVAAAFKKVQVRADEAATQLSAVTGERDTLMTKLDAGAGEDEQKRLDEFLRAQVKQRTALLATAKTILPAKDHVKLDDMDALPIMVACIKADAADPEMTLDEADETYVQGRFDAVVALRAKASPARGNGVKLGEKLLQGRNDGADDEDADSPEARADAKKKSLTQRWKKPIGAKA